MFLVSPSYAHILLNFTPKVIIMLSLIFDQLFALLFAFSMNKPTTTFFFVYPKVLIMLQLHINCRARFADCSHTDTDDDDDDVDDVLILLAVFGCSFFGIFPVLKRLWNGTISPYISYKKVADKLF